MTTSAKLSFIGAGNMASAIIGGLIAKGYTPSTITAADPSSDALTRLANETGVQTTQDNIKAILGADVIILAVKPQVMHQVLQPLQATLTEQQPLIISIAAGISMASLEAWLSPSLPIVRCMPNTPALVETGATGLLANANLSPIQKTLTDEIMAAIGISVWVDSDADIDAVTAVSGSGPAYFFLLMEAMQQAGIKLGLSSDLAEKLTLQTALGAAKMASSSDVDSAELRRRVTSPGGTTEQAIKTFIDGGFVELTEKALEAAQQRSQTLAQELDK